MKGRFWLLTIPQHEYMPYLPRDVLYVRGQLERGANTGYVHWQLLVCLSRQQRLTWVKNCFGQSAHAELSRSSAANEYVWKEDTYIDGTRFELGELPFRRNSAQDWAAIKRAAKSGDLEMVPDDIFVRHYRTLRTIASDFSEPIAIVREIYVFWGPSGVGKSRRAWEEAGDTAYPKCPLSKFWDGYRGHSHVVIDEFRGGINISHVLRWFDRYPVLVDIKGSSTVLKATKIWITSNLHPRDWYPDLDQLTLNALMRRLIVTECPIALY